VGLNPQPEPPSRPVSRVNLVGLNPQPEPPSRMQALPINRPGILLPSLSQAKAPPRRPLTVMQLQNMTQKQSQVMQMMGDVSKSMHESSLSVVRNIK
jgi:hypothetical protein